MSQNFPPPPPMVNSGEAEAIAKDAKTALILGIVGLFCFGAILGIIAVIKANGVLSKIASTGVGAESRGTANAARILGIIDIVLWLIIIILRVANS